MILDDDGAILVANWEAAILERAYVTVVKTSLGLESRPRLMYPNPFSL